MEVVKVEKINICTVSGKEKKEALSDVLVIGQIDSRGEKSFLTKVMLPFT